MVGWTDFERAFVGTALVMLVLSIVLGAVTISVVSWLHKRT